MKHAEKLQSREEVEHACTTYKSWRRIISEVLTEKRTDTTELTWEDKAKAVLDRLAKEAGESDDRHTALARLFEDQLRMLQ